MTTNESKADVVIIGAGIVGCCTAYYLAKKGVKVAIVEKGEVAGEQSSRAWGWVRQQGRNPREIPLVTFSKGLWSGLSDEIGADVEWIEEGSLKLAYTEEDLSHFEDWAREARVLGLDTRVLTRDEVKREIPALEGAFVGGIHTPSDGQTEPGRATEAIAWAARESGVALHTGRAVEGLEMEGGAIKAVVTDKGRIETDKVVCAAGAWASKVGRMVGVHLPQRVVKGTVVCTEPTDIISHCTVMTPDVTFRQKRDGTFYISNGTRSDYYVDLQSLRNFGLFIRNFLRVKKTMNVHVGKELFDDVLRALPGSPAKAHPFAHTVGVEPEPNGRFVEQSISHLRKLLPSVGELGIQRTWAGRIDASPDATPVLGEVPGVKGFYFATGMSGHGIAMGPGAGLVMSQLVLGETPSVDLHPFRFTRFEEGDSADWRKTL